MKGWNFRRWTAALLVLLMCMLPVHALADESYNTLVNEWMLTLYEQEQMYAAVDWALDYAEAFCAEKSWATLVQARMAVTAAQEEIALLKFDAAQMAAEDYLPFLMQGHDFSHVQDQFGLMEQVRLDMLLDCTQLAGLLQTNPYWKYDFEYLQSWIESQRAMLKYAMMDLGNACNYIALAAGSDEERAAVRQFYQSSCPTIFAAYEGWMEDEMLLALLAAEGNVDESFFTLWQEDEANSDRLASVILDAYEDAGNTFELQMAVSEENLNTYFRVVESGDLSELLSDRVELSGMPGMLPDPCWELEEGAYVLHSWMDVEDQLILPAVGEKIDGMPASGISFYDGVNRAAFDAYVELLHSYAENGLLVAEIVETENTAEGCTVLCLLEDASVAMLWAEDSAQLYGLDGLVAFVPGWYIMG